MALIFISTEILNRWFNPCVSVPCLENGIIVMPFWSWYTCLAHCSLLLPPALSLRITLPTGMVYAFFCLYYLTLVPQVKLSGPGLHSGLKLAHCKTFAQTWGIWNSFQSQQATWTEGSRLTGMLGILLWDSWLSQPYVRRSQRAHWQRQEQWIPDWETNIRREMSRFVMVF